MTTIGSSTIDALAHNPAAKKDKTTLDQSAFLKLMTTQLKTQDPFDPVDNQAMVAQMAQFSSVAGIAEMNASLKAITQTLAGSRVGDAASWIGRAALVESSTATALGDGSYAGEIALPEAAGNLAISLVDQSGRVVHSKNFGGQPAGSVGFAWDGKDANGAAIAGGPLRVLVTATGADGQITPTISTWAGVSAVQSPSGGAATKLVTPLGLIAPDAVQRLG